MSPRILHLSTRASGGGAARAASALHEALLAAGADSTLWTAPASLRTTTASLLDRQAWRLVQSPTRTWRSPAYFSAVSARAINAFGADVVNLHWVTDGFLSIRGIGAITAPVAWSMVDLWPVAGTEHYPSSERWRHGYLRDNRPAGERGLDLDRRAWDRKRRHWHPMHLVPASVWLEQCVSESALAGSWPVTRIPHVVDTGVFRPVDRLAARRRFAIDPSAPVVAFLASAGLADHRKGWDLLEEALAPLLQAHPDLTVVVAGPVLDAVRTAVPIMALGEIHGDEALRDLYNAADIVAVPSRMDTMPLVAMEAQSCGTPVAAFSIGGLPDIVVDRSTGSLSDPFDTAALARGIEWLLGPGAEDRRAAARAHAERTWSPAVVAARYLALYATLRAR